MAHGNRSHGITGNAFVAMLDRARMDVPAGDGRDCIRWLTRIAVQYGENTVHVPTLALHAHASTRDTAELALRDVCESLRSGGSLRAHNLFIRIALPALSAREYIG